MAPFMNVTTAGNITSFNGTKLSTMENFNIIVESSAGLGIFVMVMYFCCVCIRDKSTGNTYNLFYCCIVYPLSKMYSRIREKIESRRRANDRQLEIALVPFNRSTSNHNQSSIDSQKYIKKTADEDTISGDCPICWFELQKENERPVTISCDHVFHEKCIVQWLEKSKLECPICRGEPKVFK